MLDSGESANNSEKRGTGLIRKSELLTGVIIAKTLTEVR